MVKAGEKGSRYAVITRKDGSTRVVDRNTGRIVSGTSASGKQQRFITIGRKSGSGGRPTTTRDIINKNILNADIRRRAQLERARLERKVTKRSIQEAKQRRAREKLLKKYRGEILARQSLSGKTTTGTLTNAVMKKENKKWANAPLKIEYFPTVTASTKPSGSKLKRIDESLRKEVDKIKQNISKKKISKKNTRVDEAKLFAVALAGNILMNVRGVVEIPSTIRYFKNNPKEIKTIPRQIGKSLRRFGYIAKTSPTQAVGILAGEFIFLKGTATAIKQVGKLKNVVLTVADPRFKGVLRVGNVIKIGKYRLTVVGKLPREAMKSQVSKAGKTVSAISSQADRLLTLTKRSKIVRKPIPKEAGFTKKTKALLKKFDEGKATKKEIIQLNNRLTKIERVKGLLERSGFADPTGKIRPSRLGVLKDDVARLMDYITDNISFRRAKPQILFFRKAVVEQFPKKPIFTIIKKKLRAGKTLSKKEANELLTWQLQKSGKFKPVGFVSGESEITIPAGELLKRKKVVGVTLINGRRVPIVEVELFTPKGNLKKLLDKWETGQMNAKELQNLKRSIKRETGFNYGTSYSKTVRSRYVSPRRLTGTGSSRLLSRARSPKKSLKGSSPRSPKSRPRSPAKSPKSSKASSPQSPKSRPRSPAKSPRSGSPRSHSPKIKYPIYRLRPPVYPPISPPVTIKNILRKKRRSKLDKKKLGLWVSKAPVKYRPSLASYLYGITGYKIPKRITGFEIRPIIVKKKRKKRVIRKKRRKK